MNSLEHKNRERRVPTSRIARLASFAQLGFGLATGAAAEMIRRSFSGVLQVLQVFIN